MKFNFNYFSKFLKEEFITPRNFASILNMQAVNFGEDKYGMGVMNNKKLNDFFNVEPYASKLNELTIEQNLDKIFYLILNGNSYKKKSDDIYFYKKITQEVVKLYADSVVDGLLNNWENINETIKIFTIMALFKNKKENEKIIKLYGLFCDNYISEGNLIKKFDLFKLKYEIGKIIGSNGWKKIIESNTDDAFFIQKCIDFLNKNNEVYNFNKRSRNLFENESLSLRMRVDKHALISENKEINTVTKIEQTINGMRLCLEKIIGKNINIIKDGMDICFFSTNKDEFLKLISEKDEILNKIFNTIKYIEPNIFNNADVAHKIGNFIFDLYKKIDLKNKLETQIDNKNEKNKINKV